MKGFDFVLEILPPTLANFLLFLLLLDLPVIPQKLNATNHTSHTQPHIRAAPIEASSEAMIEATSEAKSEASVIQIS